MGAFVTTPADAASRFRPDESESTEARVRSAALACIVRFGPSKTTLEDVARESGVSRATIYRTFPGGRDSLFEAVLAGEVGRFFDELATELDRHADLEDLLVAGIGASMRFLVDHAALATIAALEPALLVPPLALQRLEGVLAMATAFAAPYLRPHLPSDPAAASGAEHLVRVVLSYTLHPSDAVDPHDAASIRTLVRHHILPGLRPAAAQPPSA